MSVSIEESINEIYINTGNLLASEILKRKVTLLAQEEIINGINLTIDYSRKHGKLKSENGTTLTLRNEQLFDGLMESNRSHYKIIIKMFTYSECCRVFSSAIDFILKQLEINFLDSLIISLPPSQVKHTIEQIKPIWLCIEKIFTDGKALDVGITDLDTNQLKELFNWAQTVKPSTNQINLDVCCVIPPDMTSFANENNVKLLTHNDPRDFIPLDKFHQIMKNCGVQSVNDWQRDWIARYSVMIKGKGLIKSKGYILRATRK